MKEDNPFIVAMVFLYALKKLEVHRYEDMAVNAVAWVNSFYISTDPNPPYAE